METVADRLRVLRRAQGLSQTALAGAQLSPSYVSLIEAGKRQPTEEALAILARRLGTTVTYLSTGKHTEPETSARLELAFAELALANGAANEAKEKLANFDVTTLPAPLRSEVAVAFARCHEALGELEEAARLLEKISDETAHRQAWLQHANAVMMLVGCYLESGNLNRSVVVGDTAIAALREAGLEASDEGVRLAATVIWAIHERGDLLYAQIRAAELTQLAEAEGSSRARASIYWNGALVAQSRGNDEEALRLTERSLALFAEEGNSRDLPRLRVHYAGLLIDGKQDDPREALRQLDKALPELEAQSSVIDVAYGLVEQARAFLALGEVDSAEAAAQKGLALLGGNTRLDACHAWLVLGDIAWSRGDQRKAKRHYRQAADTLGMMESTRAASAAWRKLGDRLQEVGELTQALDAYDRALKERGLPAAVKPIGHVPSRTVDR